MTPRKNNSFERALVDAEKRLAQALNERSQAQETLNDLAKEIPNLQRTVAALELQLNPQAATRVEMKSRFEFSEEMTLDNTADMPAQDLRGMGAIRNGETIAITEDDTLPEPEGTPLTPED